jgi:hypothetical protein
MVDLYFNASDFSALFEEGEGFEILSEIDERCENADVATKAQELGARQQTSEFMI